jgi:hypothetical protein
LAIGLVVEPREGERDFSGLHSTASLLDSTTSPMANKRKRQDNPTNPTNEPGMDNDEAAEEAQQDREEEQQPQEAILPDGTVVKLPQVRSHPHLTTLNQDADEEMLCDSRNATTVNELTPTRSQTTS